MKLHKNVIQMNFRTTVNVDATKIMRNATSSSMKERKFDEKLSRKMTWSISLITTKMSNYKYNFRIKRSCLFIKLFIEKQKTMLSDSWSYDIDRKVYKQSYFNIY